MEKELEKIKEEIAKLKTKIFDLEIKTNNMKDKLRVIYVLMNRGRKLFEVFNKEE